MKHNNDNHIDEYADIITYYYDIIIKRSIKQHYKEIKGTSYLRKLDEWENRFWDIQDIGA